MKQMKTMEKHCIHKKLQPKIESETPEELSYADEMSLQITKTECKNKKCESKTLLVVILILLIQTLLVMFYYFENINHSQDVLNGGSGTSISKVNNNLAISSLNSSLCHSQYTILHQIRVSICRISKDTVVDIREFIQDHPTVNGIQFSFNEWTDFMSYIGLIDYMTRNGPI